MTQLSIVARSAAVRSRFGSAFGPRRRVSAGDAAEDGAGRDLAGGARAGRHGVGIVGRLTRERFLALRKAMRRERIADAQPVAERHPILHVFGPERVAIGV